MSEVVRCIDDRPFGGGCGVCGTVLQLRRILHCCAVALYVEVVALLEFRLSAGEGDFCLDGNFWGGDGVAVLRCRMVVRRTMP